MTAFRLPGAAHCRALVASLALACDAREAQPQLPPALPAVAAPVPPSGRGPAPRGQSLVGAAHSTLEAARAATPLTSYLPMRIDGARIEAGAEQFFHAHADRTPTGIVLSVRGEGELRVEILDGTLKPFVFDGPRDRRLVNSRRIELLSPDLRGKIFVRVSNPGPAAVFYDAVLHAVLVMM